MPAIKVTKHEKNLHESSSSDGSPVLRKGKKSNDIKNMKILAEASKYVKDPEAEVFYWRKQSSTSFVPEVREQSQMIVVDNRIYIFGGLSHD